MSYIEPHTATRLRQWLKANFKTSEYPIWVTIYKKSSGKQSLSYEQVLEEAICFGLIDTQTKTIDELRYAICLRRRKAGSNWTAANREIARQMIIQGRMTEAGRKVLPA